VAVKWLFRAMHLLNGVLLDRYFVAVVKSGDSHYFSEKNLSSRRNFWDWWLHSDSVEFVHLLTNTGGFPYRAYIVKSRGRSSVHLVYI
jgi:hypothetical protein